MVELGEFCAKSTTLRSRRSRAIFEIDKKNNGDLEIKDGIKETADFKEVDILTCQGYLHVIDKVLFYDDAGGSDGARSARPSASPPGRSRSAPRSSDGVRRWSRARGAAPGTPPLRAPFPDPHPSPVRSRPLDTATVPCPTPTMFCARAAAGGPGRARRPRGGALAARLERLLYQPLARFRWSGIRGATPGSLPEALHKHIKGLLRVEGVVVVQLAERGGRRRDAGARGQGQRLQRQEPLRVVIFSFRLLASIQAYLPTRALANDACGPCRFPFQEISQSHVLEPGPPCPSRHRPDKVWKIPPRPRRRSSLLH